MSIVPGTHLNISPEGAERKRLAVAASNRRRAGLRKVRPLGIRHTPESRAKISAALKGNRTRELATVKGDCAYCWAVAHTYDHPIPRGRPGWDDPGNKVPACWRCNTSKGPRTPEEWLSAGLYRKQ